MPVKSPSRALLSAALLASVCGAAPAGLRAEPLTVFAEGSYLFRDGEGRDVARGIALYRARREALSSAFADTEGGGPGTPWAREVRSLATEEIASRIVEELNLEGEQRHVVRVEAVVDERDVARAGISALRQEGLQLSLPYREEMRQDAGAAVSPGREIARAYGLIRNRHWRLAAIYLDHLAGKYPYWGEIYLAQAMVLRGTHRPEEAREALARGCDLECPEACGAAGASPAPAGWHLSSLLRQP